MKKEKCQVKMPEDMLIKQEILRMMKLINGGISIAYIALAVYGLVKLIGVFV